jgi:hypothetical protein
LHTKIPPNVSIPLTILERNGEQDLKKKTSDFAGQRGFSGLTIYKTRELNRAGLCKATEFVGRISV